MVSCAQGEGELLTTGFGLNSCFLTRRKRDLALGLNCANISRDMNEGFSKGLAQSTPSGCADSAGFGSALG